MIFDLDLTYNQDDILNNISEKDIYEYFLSKPVERGKLYNCFFHEDNRPSMGLYSNRNSKYLTYKCFSCGESGNIFELVKKLTGIEDIQDIYRYIINNFGNKELNKNSTILNTINNNFNIKNSFDLDNKVSIYPKFRSWDIRDYDYWKQYGITFDILEKFNVKPCSSVYMRTSRGNYIQYALDSKSYPIYHYYCNGNSTIYKPLNSSGRWLKNSGIWDVYGLEQLEFNNNIVFITSSLKDVMTLYNLGYSAVAPQGEGMIIPDKIIDYLFAISNKLILFYDNDSPGKQLTNKLKEYYNIESILIPDNFPKDISDYYKKYNEENSKKLITNLLKNVY